VKFTTGNSKEFHTIHRCQRVIYTAK